MGRGHPATLIPMSPGPDGTGAIRGRIGGLATAAAGRRRKAIREVVAQVMQVPLPERYQEAANLLVQVGLPPTVEYGIALAMAELALSGKGGASVEAARYLRDTLGESPTAAKTAVKALQSCDMGDTPDQVLIDYILGAEDMQPVQPAVSVVAPGQDCPDPLPVQQDG